MQPLGTNVVITLDDDDLREKTIFISNGPCRAAPSEQNQ